MAKEEEILEIDSKLVAHAKHELDFVGLLDEDADYNGMIAKSVLEMIELFAGQGHSGHSAMLTLDIFTRLASYRPLTRVTIDPNEWEDVSSVMFTKEELEKGSKLWQNRRSPSVFSKDGGITWRDYETNTEGRSVTIEEALNGPSKDNETKTEQGESGDSQVSSQGEGSPEAEASKREDGAIPGSDQGVQPQPATKSQGTTDPRHQSEQGNVGGSQPRVEQTDRKQRSKYSKSKTKSRSQARREKIMQEGK